MRKLSRWSCRSWLSGSLLTAAWLAFAAPALADSFGPLAVAPPSAIVPESGTSEALAGSITLDVASIPVLSSTLFSLTNVSVLAGGGASFALDPTVLSPALGVAQAAGNFLIPTLFLRVANGASSFDLAIPNVTGTLFFGAGGSVVGIASSFEVDSLSPSGTLTVNLLAGVPEPGTALLLILGLGALGMRAPKETSR